ncbi:YfhO family protein [Streptococcus thoraltensis]|uniref:YfhO family protein n=1 Tax=Streptococcus thoraltensis TaxID=55085 RepID=UPI001F584576|nr:YfhO family protein [Streptococcus thoraltensis]
MTSKFTLKKGLPYLLGFLFPILIMVIVLLTNEIWWGSNRTILASDGFHQYAIFAQNLRNILHGSDSIFYTFTSGLGLNFYALISYYLGSFLSPFLYFFSLRTIPEAIYLFTLLKFGFAGLTMFTALRQLYSNVNKVLLLSLSTSYALMSFAISQLEINTWLDVFIIAPLIILGLHRLLEKRLFWLYYASLTVLFIQNYYFGFMMAIFLTLYFLVQQSRVSSWKKSLRKVLDFTFISVFSALSSSIMLLPTYLDLSTHGEQFSTFEQWLSKDAWYLDVFAKNIIGAYDTTKFGSIPMIYVGLFPLILSLIFFTLSAIKWQIRLAYFLLISIIIVSFYLEPLDLLWQGMHAPNMFLHRYSWLLSLLFVFMAAETLSHWKSFNIKNIIIPFMFLFSGVSVTAIFQKEYEFLTTSQFILTIIFLISYATILLNNNRLLPKGFLISFTLFFTLFEVFINSFFVVRSLGDEWVFPTREGYERNLTDIEKLVNYSKSKETNFYRTERILPQTGNDSMKFNYNGISQFSSIRNTASSSILDRLGFQSNGTNLNLRYQNNTIIADSLFDVKYNLAQSNPQKFGFTKEKSSGSMKLYKNAYALPLGVLSNKVYKDVNFTVNTLDNQADFLNQLSGLSEDYFQRLLSNPINNSNNLSDRVTLKADQFGTTKISYQVSVPAHQQVYVSVPNISFANDSQKEVTISHDKVSQTYTTDNAYTFFNVGYFEKAQTIIVTLSFPNNATISFDSPNFYGLNTLSYQNAIKAIKKQTTQTKTDGNNVLTTYHAKRDSSIVYTLPFDKGWQAKVNGKKTTIRRAQKGFMSVNVPKGKGTIELTFIPQGLKEGSLLSLLGLGLFIFYSLLSKFFKRGNLSSK